MAPDELSLTIRELIAINAELVRRVTAMEHSVTDILELFKGGHSRPPLAERLWRLENRTLLWGAIAGGIAGMLPALAIGWAALSIKATAEKAMEKPPEQRVEMKKIPPSGEEYLSFQKSATHERANQPRHP